MRFPSLAFWLVTPATLGLLQPHLVRAQTPTVRNSPPLIRDVELLEDAALAGLVNDVQGRPLPRVDVLLSQRGREVARTTTAEDGRFLFPGLPGGIYEVSAGGGGGIYRVWQNQTAPPGAVRAVVVVAKPDAVRGQSPHTGFYRSDAFLISAAVLGAIAIPIVISISSRDQPPGS